LQRFSHAGTAPRPDALRREASNQREDVLRLKTVIENKDTFLKYNEVRKRTFLELSPKAADIILYLVPWLLSVNHPACPGYIRGLRTPLQVADIHREREILGRENAYKRLFSIYEDGAMLKFYSQANTILGIYTIGSTGTISQTEHSDCDIWICIDKRSYDTHTLQQLFRKVNLLKNWLDTQLKQPAYFFISDIEDIRNCHFGQVDEESCGTTQKNILKEEFYRTMIVIAGKIPLWWICHDKEQPVVYRDFAKELTNHESESQDFVDLGDIEGISQDEYFGAALWQLNKSLTYPLKSIIKMLLLKMQIDSPPGIFSVHDFARRSWSRVLLPRFPIQACMPSRPFSTTISPQDRNLWSLSNIVSICALTLRCSRSDRA
jgi:adenylate cyclase, class 1